MFKRLGIITLAVGALAFAAPAHAAFITGSISLNPFGTGLAPTPSGSNFSNATGVSFGAGPNAVTGATHTGTFAAVAQGTQATFTDFTFKPNLVPSPVNPLWTFTFGGSTFSFVLDAITSVGQTTIFGTNFLNLSGSGFLEVTGFDNTPSTFAFTGTDTGTGNFTFTSTENAASVPEPGSMALLGSGLVGCAAAVRRRLRARRA